MSEWRVVRFGDVVAFNPESIKKGYPNDIIEYLDISSVGSNVSSGTQQYKLAEAPGRAKRLVRDGDTIISTVRPNLKTYMKISNPQDNLVVSTGFAVMRPMDDIDTDFLFYSATTKKVIDELAAIADSKTTSYPAVSADDIANIKIAMPEKSTQKKIGHVLLVFDNLITNNNCRIAIFEEMAQRLYRNEVLKTDTVCALGEQVRFRRGKTITKATISEGIVPVVAGGIQPAYYHNRANAKAPVLTVSASGANAGHVNLYHVDIWASDCSLIDANDTENVFYYYTAMKELQRQITFMQRGSAQPHVYPDDLSRLEIPALSLETIDRLNKVLVGVFNSIGNLKRKNEVLRKTRDHLLPRLISGDIDVSKIELSTEECT